MGCDGLPRIGAIHHDEGDASLRTTTGDRTNRAEAAPMGVTTAISRHGVTLPAEAIAAICERYGVRELSVFGSLLRDDFTPESDIDFLVVFDDDDYGPWMGKLTRMEDDLRAVLGRKVDLVPKESILRSENWIRRDHILGTARVIYGS
jgi:predicted nucleotidyltransferase